MTWSACGVQGPLSHDRSRNLDTGGVAVLQRRRGVEGQSG
eukprot:CAMPEP_0184318024 /NCGR_PEP_ID=MMETSP1049-20130417/100107_1 /TAXON_ID=77928 /ORGANISM="Proteomonas sulcata, Strain CCMP704" /LENGTH=39 /DNA_ID= /DNA_START= /DNA_END= /DNA_ORIENTATION=